MNENSDFYNMDNMSYVKDKLENFKILVGLYSLFDLMFVVFVRERKFNEKRMWNIFL